VRMTPLAARLPAPRLTPSSTTPGPSGSQPGGPFGHYLRDPGGSLHCVEHAVTQWLSPWGLVAGALIAVASVTLVACRIWWRRRQQAELVRGARLVTVLAPPVVDPAGAAALWSNLTGLLRPAWRRRLAGQPHVGFEYSFDADGLTLRLWVPGVVPPAMVEHAIQAAWPGAHTSTLPASPPGEQAAEAPVGTPRRLAGGGELRLARSEALPIRTGFDADPIRALLGAPAGLLPGERAVVQVLARPVTGRRVARARRAATRLHTGASARPVGRLLDLITPGTGGHRTPAARNTAGSAMDRFTSLEYSAQDRAAAGKQRGALFETRVRYTVTTPVRFDADRAAVAAATDRLRGRAHAIASAFSVFAEHNHYQRHRLRHPDQAVDSRRLGHGAPKGSLGEETTRLVGSLVVASVWQTTTARAGIPQQQRRDCGLYVDECQNFLNLPYPLEDMLAEARGFRLSMTLAHQHLGQLSRDLHDGIAANARNKIFFTASPDDARSLARHTAPRLSEHDLAHLDAFHAAGRLVVAGQATAPFTFTTTPLPPAVPGSARAMRRASIRTVGRTAGPGVAATGAGVALVGDDPRLEPDLPQNPADSVPAPSVPDLEEPGL